MDKIQNILLQVLTIKNKYADLAEYSGEHFNIFNILGVRSDELSHSAILTNLLNVKGGHGQKDLFLKIFIESVKNSFKNDEAKMQLLNNFNTSSSKAEKEKFAGKVNYASEEGGRIDIVINDGNNNIIIENKVYAGDQKLQLVRYNEYDRNAPIIYLTLYGTEPSKESMGNLKNGNEYACISYQIEIVSWLEQCIKEMANKPIIRETLNQYLFLIKSLTNLSNNNKMKEEIASIILNNESNFETFKEIYNVKNSLLPIVFRNKILPILKGVCTPENELELIINEDSFAKNQNRWGGFSFRNDYLTKNNVSISFSFNVASGFKELIFGFTYLKREEKNSFDYSLLKENFKKLYKNSKGATDYWPCWVPFEEYRNWEDLDTIQKILYSDFEKSISEKIELMLEISKNSF